MFNANLIMRELRKAKGLTQEQLAEGICSRSAIAMIEKGERKPDWHIFSGAMQKLGVEPRQFYNDIASEEDVAMFNYNMKLHQLFSSRDFEALKVEFEKMENDEKFSTGLGRRLHLDVMRLLYLQKDYRNLERSLECATELIKLSRPDFDINKLDEYFLTTMELVTISSFATIHFELKDYEKESEIRKKIVRYYEHHRTTMSLFEKMYYVEAIVNFALSLLNLKAYDDCIEECDKAIKHSVGLDIATHVHMRAIACKSFALGHLGQKEEREFLFKRYLFYCWAVIGHMDITNAGFEEQKENWEKAFGYKLDLTLPW